MSKLNLKSKAIKLRKQGKTYSEILSIVPVAKSTLSDWLKGVDLTAAQRQRITEKSTCGRLKGAKVRRDDRVERQNLLIKKAKTNIGSISRRELWLIGIALYWAEGSKEKVYSSGARTSFSNSDPKMIALYIMWLRECMEINSNELIISIYIHESHKNRIVNVQKYWSETLGLPISFFSNVYFKKNKILTLRKNTGDLYNGLLRVNIRSSSSLNRRITGWIQGITEYWGIV